MIPKVAAAVGKLDRSKGVILGQVHGWTPEDLLLQPAAGSWSAAQVVQHIAMVESEILHAVKANVATPHVLTANDRVGSFIVRCVMRAPIRVKSPEQVAINPAAACSYETSVRLWDEARREWTSFLGEVSEGQMQGGVFTHPRGGWFTMPETLLFLRLHHEHHVPQLRRIGTAVRRPG